MQSINNDNIISPKTTRIKHPPRALVNNLAKPLAKIIVLSHQDKKHKDILRLAPIQALHHAEPYKFSNYPQNNPRAFNFNHAIQPLTAEQIPSILPPTKSDWHACPDKYSPDFWNNENLRVRVNCYAYALGLINNPITGKPLPEYGYSFGLQPGQLSGSPKRMSYKYFHAEYIAKCVKADIEAVGGKVEKCELNTPIPQNCRKIALFVHPQKDYHFLWQDKFNTWSHKRYVGVSTLDGSGNTITDPQKANLKFNVHYNKEYNYYETTEYNEFGGYFLIYPPNQK